MQAAALGGVFERDFRGFALPRPHADIVEEVRDAAPVPMLRLVNRRHNGGYWVPSREADGSVDIALFGFSYDGRVIDLAADPEEMRRVEGGRLVVQRRDIAAERTAYDRLRRLGLGPPGDFIKRSGDGAYLALSLRQDTAGWPGFVYQAVPLLEAEGWRIEFEDGFRHRVVEGGGDWTAAVSEGSAWWFSFDLGIDVDGERVPLLPVLTALLRQLRHPGMPDSLDALAHNGTVFGTLADGRLVALPLERTKAILSALVELYHPETLSPSGALDISAGEGAALAAVEAATRLRWLGGERLRALVQRLKAFAQIEPVAPKRSCACISRPGSTGCSSCAPSISAAFSPTIWVSAKPCRRSPISWSRSARGGSTGPALSSARPVWCRIGAPRRHVWHRNCASSRCTAPTARGGLTTSPTATWW